MKGKLLGVDTIYLFDTFTQPKSYVTTEAELVFIKRVDSEVTLRDITKALFKLSTEFMWSPQLMTTKEFKLRKAPRQALITRIERDGVEVWPDFNWSVR